MREYYVDHIVNDDSNVEYDIADASSRRELLNRNSFNILVNATHHSGTGGGVTWTWNDDDSITVSGTATADSGRLLCGSANSIPEGIIPGETYYVKFSGEIVYLQIKEYVDETNTKTYRLYNDTVITVPENVTGYRIALYVANGNEVNETVTPVIMNSLTNKELEKASLTIKTPSKTIPAGSDLNDYIDAGQWSVGSAAIASQISNMPLGRAGRLLVMHNNMFTNTLKTVTQIYIANGGNMYIRYYSLENGVSTFTEWKHVAYSTEIDSVKDDTLTLVTDFRPATDTGDDLNDYLTPGQWRVPSQAKAKSLLNKPRDFASTGLLTVLNTHNTNHVYQIIATNGTTNVWVRHIRIDIQQFDEWKSVVTADDSLYSWQKPGFNIHSPSEEQEIMIETVEDYLGITIAGTTDWPKTDGNGNRIISASMIYQMWDSLRTKYPNYIDAGEVIGYSLDPDGNNYMPIKAYYIHPRLSYTSGSNTININYDEMPTIYLTAGTHGGESTPTWNLFETFRRAFMTGTIYSELLTGVKFRVIPCLDCWSYDNKKRYLAAAYYSDGTQKVSDDALETYDANRQCICSDPSNPSYSNLTIPSFAKEAEALTNYMETHGFGSVDGDSYIDMHNCSYSLGYLTTDKSIIANAYNTMMDELAKDWKANTSWANGDAVDYYSGSTSDHSALHGKILARESVETSYAWFFEKAYPSFTSNIMEVQQTDGSAGNNYAIAKSLDITYRWFKYVKDTILWIQWYRLISIS